MRWAGLSLFKFLRYLKEEILIVLGTSSSESALPLMMEKMERLGCSKPMGMTSPPPTWSSPAVPSSPS